MNERAAIELAGQWLAAHQQPNGEPLNLRAALAEDLQGGFPDPEIHGVAESSDGPCLLSLAGETFLFASATIDPEKLAVVDMRVFPLVPRPAITVKSTASADGTSKRRRWQLQPAVGDPIAVMTNEVVRAMFAADVRPDTGELLMRAVLSRVVDQEI
jgi:hypothetical protein